jgi:hypothetical protein
MKQKAFCPLGLVAQSVTGASGSTPALTGFLISKKLNTMPNHITNRLKINGTNQQIKSVFEKYNTHVEARLHKAHDGTILCKNETDVGWFNLKTGVFKARKNNYEVIGLPEGWAVQLEPCLDCFPDFDKIIPHPKCDEYNDIPSQDAVRNSPNWWRTWNVNNWGTKWGGYSYRSGDYGVYFWETAWSGVPKLMQELSKQCPEIEFEYAYADEDSGYNTGIFVIKNGVFISEYRPEGGTKESYDIYFLLHPEDLINYVLIDGIYKYKDDEEAE